MADYDYKEGRDYSLATNCPETRFGILLSQLGSKFIACQRDYVRCFLHEDAAQDLGYFYNERANIGFLAAAAWRQRGWVAIEEFVCDKRDRIEKGKFARGRADLYVGVRSDRKVTSISIEAKQCYVQNGSSLRAALDLKQPKSALSRAVADARHGVDADHQCAAVFVCETLRYNQHYERHDQEISEAFYETCSGFGMPWVAFAYFPREQYAWEKDNRGVERRYPAVGVVIVKL
ncbi:hypothetical protein ABIB00_005439 [Bradyrhizobium sp. LB14.3]|uniref:hypothetical protein n=1 Tax=Bradyrhizobium sp. LB14.3 TaxID=3156328 RepID=UPI003397C5A6